MVFSSGFLVFCIGALECYPGACLPEKICNFPKIGAVLNEGDPFLHWLFLVGVLLCMFQFSFLLTDNGKMLLFTFVRIVCHSVFLFSWRERKRYHSND
jgi:hypothetical protein